MIVDLHCHTSASDGALSPTQLIARAAERGVNILSITDHDTLAAYREITELPASLTLVPGIELSCQWQKRGIHIVGLNVDMAAASMVEATQKQGEARTLRAQLIAEKLAKLGAQSPLEGALTLSDGGSVGRPHFARHLVESGFVASEAEAFKKYLGSGKPGDIKVCWPELEQVVTWIRDAGGIAVVAHPGKYNLTRTKLVALLEAFTECGGQALEVVSGRQLPNETRDYANLCRQFDLKASAGSDFHSPTQTWLDLGHYTALPGNLTPVWEAW